MKQRHTDSTIAFNTNWPCYGVPSHCSWMNAPQKDQERANKLCSCQIAIPYNHEQIKWLLFETTKKKCNFNQ